MVARSRAAAAALAMVAAGVPAPVAHAATFYCDADAHAYLGVGSNGYVYTGVSNGSGMVITAICSLSSADGDVTPQACSAWYAMLLTQRTAGGKVLPHFDTTHAGNTALTGCADLKPWEHHTPYFIPAQ
ncbi:hypothetical protein KZ813_10685 [Sphingomonas sp. RHCKR7]|uniref:hypothetical protein n=1 Tax=Sphingomonas folli TaxID=2862497 RepID=UPI001CA5E428|nr:hypothetical protein [Sphingomonas folli]MBW6527306.1 hypothetical protein [Sphingomonas folli]